MTYWIVMFQVDPIPLGAPGPIKLQVTRAAFEVANQDASATVDCSKGKFKINEKRMFSLEEERCLFIVADVVRIDRLKPI